MPLPPRFMRVATGDPMTWSAAISESSRSECQTRSSTGNLYLLVVLLILTFARGPAERHFVTAMHNLGGVSSSRHVVEPEQQIQTIGIAQSHRIMSRQRS